MSQQQLALEELTKQAPEAALALIKAEKLRLRKEQFVKFWEATPTQGKLFHEFDSTIKTFGILGGNRSGKTEIGAFIAVAWALGKEYFRGEPAWDYVKDLPIPEKANNIWVVGLDFPTLRDVIWREKLRFGRNHPGLVPRSALAKDPNDSDYQIFFANGSVITGKSADSGREKFQGASVDLVWIDEEPEVDVFDECYQRTVDCGGRILITLTPLTDVASGVKTPWVFDLYRDWQKGQKDVKFFKLSVLDNPYVPAEEKQKLLEKWQGHHEERARLYGDFVQKSGMVYPMWNPLVHCIKPFLVPGHWMRIVSIDPAATGTTAAVWGAIQPTTNDMYLYREYYKKDLIVSDHAKNILLRNQGDPVDIWLIDPKWGTQRNAETHKQNYQLYRENGIPVRLAEVGEDYGMNASREYMNATVTAGSRNPKVWLFDDLHNFRDEIEHYVWDFFAKGDQKGLSKDKPVKRKDHLMNAWQYLCALRPKARTRSDERTLEQKIAESKHNSYT